MPKTRRARLVEILEPLIGAPWERCARGPAAYDCWGLVIHLQAALFGRDLPMGPSLEAAGADPKSVLEAIRKSPLQRLWLPVAAPAHGDLVLLRRRRDPAHIGMWVDGGPDLRGVIHSVEGGGVMLQDLAQIRANWPGVEFRRHVGPAAEAAAEAGHPAVRPGHALLILVRDLLAPMQDAELIAVPAGASPLEALEALTPDLRRAGEWLMLGTEPLLRSHPETGVDEWRTRRLAEGDLLFVCPLPPEGDGSSILAAVAAVVLAVAAPYLAVGLAGAAAGTVTAGAVSLTAFGKAIALGITIGGQMLIGALTRPSTALDRGPAAPSPTYSATPPGNRINPGGQIARLYGTVRRQPDLLARPWGQFSENSHELHFLLCVGLGRYRINAVYVEDTPVWTRQGGYSGAAPSARIEIVEPGAPVTLFPADVVASGEIGGQTLAPPAGGAAQNVGPFVLVPPGRQANRLAFDFALPQGLFALDDGGGERALTVSFAVDLRALDEAGAPKGSWFTVLSESLRLATTTPQRFTRAVDVSLDRYEARFRRTNAAAGSDRARDELVLAGARAFVPGDQAFSDLTAVAIRIRADETTSQATQAWSVDATAILPHWNAATQTWAEGPTERIEAALLDVMTAPYGLALPETRIDRPALEALAETWGARGDLCCLAVDRAQSCWEVLSAVARCGRALPQAVGANVTIVRDQPRALPVQAVGPDDMRRGGFSVLRAHHVSEGPTVVRARYWDRQGRMRDVLCVPPGVTSPREAVVDLPGIVDHAQAWREGMYMAAANLHRRRFLSFAMDPQGRALRRGDLIRVAHPRPAYGRGAMIAAMAWPRLILTAPHGIAQGDARQHWLTIARPDGSAWGPVRMSAGAAEDEILIHEADAARAIASDARPGYSADPRDWIAAEATLSAPEGRAGGAQFAGSQSDPSRVLWGPDAGGPVLCVVQAMTPRADGSVEISAAVESPAVHTADQGVAPAEPAPSALSSQAGAPLWSGARAAVVETPGGAKMVRISGPSIPGALRYDAQVSVDQGATWAPAASAASPLLEFAAPSAAILLVRAAAVGSLRGPWAAWTLDGETPLWALRAPEALRALEAPEPDYRWAWRAVAGAESYDVEVLTLGVLRRAASVTAPAYDYAAALQRPDGGPWRAATLRVRGRRGAEAGPWATLASSNGAPPPPTGLAYLGAGGPGGSNFGWTPSPDPTVAGYRLIAGSIASPVASAEIAGRASRFASLSGLSPGETYQIRIAALDGVPEDVLWSAPVSAAILAPEDID